MLIFILSHFLEEVWLDHHSSDPRSQITGHITLKNWNNHTVIIRVIAFTPFLPDEKGEMYLSDGWTKYGLIDPKFYRVI